MHRVLTNNQVKVLQEIVEHLSASTVKNRKVTITEFFNACKNNKAIVNEIVNEINKADTNQVKLEMVSNIITSAA